MKKHSVSSLALVFVLFALTGCGGGGGGSGGTTFPQLNEVCSAKSEIAQAISTGVFQEINAHQFAARIREKRDRLWTQTFGLQGMTMHLAFSSKDGSVTSDQSSKARAQTTGPGITGQAELLCGFGDTTSTGAGSIAVSEYETSIDSIGNAIRLSTHEEVMGWNTRFKFGPSGNLLSSEQVKSTNTTSSNEWAVYEDGDQLQNLVDSARGPVSKDGSIVSMGMHFYANPAGQLGMSMRIDATTTVSKDGSTSSATVAGDLFMVLQAY